MASFQKSINGLSKKHLAIDKANTKVVIAAAMAAAIVVFSMFSAKAIIGIIGYQNKVISERNQAIVELDANIEAIEQLNAAYISFDSAEESYLGTSEKNSKIILDALPSKYDFPALATSLEYLTKSAGLSLSEITGTDDEVAALQSSVNPTPVEIPFGIGATGNYSAVQTFIDNLARSIRPMKVQTLIISSNEEQLAISLTGLTYYQPSKELGIEEAIVTSDGSAQAVTTDATSVDATANPNASLDTGALE